MDINFTATGNYYLCSDCEHNLITGCIKGTDTPSGTFFCNKHRKAVGCVGVCKDFVERRKEP